MESGARHLTVQEGTRRGAPLWRLPRRGWWTAYALGALAVSLAVALSVPMWFRDTDAPYQFFVASHGIGAIANPSAGVLEGGWRPVTLGLWWLAFHAFGGTYWLYQFVQTLLWFATLLAYYLMLRNLWGHARPALVAAGLTPLAYFWINYYAFHFAQVDFQLELLLGFASVALAGYGWRRRHNQPVILSWFVLVLAYGAKEPAMLFLPVLHVAAGIVIGRSRRLPWWRIGLSCAVVLAITVGQLWLIWPNLGQWLIWPTWAELAQRWNYYAGLSCGDGTGVMLAMLAALAGFAQAMRLSLKAWPLAVGLGGLLALAGLGVHPLLPAIALTLLLPQAWPFTLWGLVMQGSLLFLQPMGPIYLLESSFAYVPLFVQAIWRSPVTALARATLVRIGPTELNLVRTGLILAGVVALAHFDELLSHQFQALRTVSYRRQVTRALTDELVRRAPRGAEVAIVSYSDIGGSPGAVRDLPPEQRAQVMLQFSRTQYAQMLALAGRADLRVVSLDELSDLGTGWLLVTSDTEMAAAGSILGNLGAPEAPVQRGQVTGGLWKVPRGRASRPAATSQSPATQPVSSGVTK